MLPPEIIPYYNKIFIRLKNAHKKDKNPRYPCKHLFTSNFSDLTVALQQ